MTTGAVNFDYHFIEHVPPHYLYTVGATFSDGGKVVATVHEDLTVTRTPRIIIRLADGSRVINVDNIHDIIMRVRAVQPLPAGVDVSVYGEDGSLIGVVPLEGSFDLKQRAARPVELPSHTVPTPPPTTPPVLDTWKVTHPDGMNIRSTPQVTADNSNLVGSVPTGWLFDNDGSGATSTTYHWNYIYSGEHNGKNFAGNWIAVENRHTGYEFCELDLGLEPPATGTVQLTGDIQLVKRPDGYTRLTNVPPVGFNLRNFFYYAKPEWQDLTLDWMQAHGFKWMRAYAPKEGYTQDQSLSLIETGIKKANARGIKFCLVGADSIRDSAHVLSKLIPWHTGPMGHLIWELFTSGEYTKHYFPWLDRLATEFGSDLGMIDVMNEPALYPRAGGHLTITQDMTDAFVDCFAEACRIVYSASGGRVPSTVGWINANHFRPANKDGLQHARETAQRMQYMQAYSFHVYAEPVAINPSYHPDALFRFEEDVHNMDFVAARETDKALIVGEYGSYESNAGRAQSIRNFRTRNPEAEIMWYWGVCPLVQGQNKDIVINTGDCDGHALVLGRDGEGEFWDCVEAAKA